MKENDFLFKEAAPAPVPAAADQTPKQENASPASSAPAEPSSTTAATPAAPAVPEAKNSDVKQAVESTVVPVVPAAIASEKKINAGMLFKYL